MARRNRIDPARVGRKRKEQTAVAGGRRRVDPVAREADAPGGFDQIWDKDPNRDYVLVHPNDVDTYLDAHGYEIEVIRPGGPRATGRKLADGQEVRSGGHILMSCPKEVRAARDKRLGRRGLEIQAMILKNEGLQDGLRGRLVARR